MYRVPPAVDQHPQRTFSRGCIRSTAGIERVRRSSVHPDRLCSEARVSPQTGLTTGPANCARQFMVYAGTYVAERIARAADRVSALGALPRLCPAIRAGRLSFLMVH